MTFFQAHKQEAVKLGLGGDADPLRPGVSQAGSGTARDPKMAHLAEIVTQLNTLFDDTAFTDADRVAIYNHILGKMAENESLQEQARAKQREAVLRQPRRRQGVSRCSRRRDDEPHRDERETAGERTSGDGVRHVVTAGSLQ